MEHSLPSSLPVTQEFDGVIGIDLGTTYSCVAVLQNNQVDVIPNDQGSRITPSFVAFQQDVVLVGDGAKNLAMRGVGGVVFDAKRMIGHRFSDKTIQEDSAKWPFIISQAEGDRICINATFRGEELHLAPEEVSARVLVYLKQCAERYLGKQVKKAVITVPAYFNDSQRQATKDAGTIAGLEVLRIINEPTAAALSYGFGTGGAIAKGKEQPVNVVVFDLGGGTFDVSVITIDMGSFAVRATAGDTHLGGQDIDTNLLCFVTDDLEKRFAVRLADHPRQWAKARATCEYVKRALSHSTTEEFALDGVLPNGEEYVLSISRAKLEELNASLFERCMNIVKKALKDAALSVGDVHEVILVGGSSRIPKLQELLSRLFNGKKLCKSVHPDEAVAIGAAIQASILSDAPAQQSEKAAGVVLMDVVPLSIGVEVDDVKFDVIIPRNTTIPYKATKEYSTIDDNQTIVDICVYEGERPLTRYNHKLGEFFLEGITKAKHGVPTITVTFSVDANGLLTVTATEALANKSRSLVVQNTERLSVGEVQSMIETAKRLQEVDAVDVTKAEARMQILEALAALKRAVEETTQPLSSKLQKRLTFVTHGEEWVEHQLPTYTDASKVKAKCDKILKLIRKAMKRVRKETPDADGSKRARHEESEPGAPEEDAEDSDSADSE